MGNQIEQMSRMLRWLERFREIVQSVESHVETIDPDRCKDDIIAFFQNCYHLKDWIINDPSLVVSNQVVEDYVNSRPALCLAADLCNGTKHLLLKNHRSGLNPSLAQNVIVQSVNLQAEAHRVSIEYSWTVSTDSGSQDAYTLACDCVTDWQDFLAGMIKTDSRSSASASTRPDEQSPLKSFTYSKVKVS